MVPFARLSSMPKAKGYDLRVGIEFLVPAGVQRSYFLFADSLDPTVNGAYIDAGAFEGQIGTLKSADALRKIVVSRGILFAGFVCVRV